MEGPAASVADAIAAAGFVRIAECEVRPNRCEHFIECQRRIWNPAMRDAGMLRGAFSVNVEDPHRFLVCSFWPDEATHAGYAMATVPRLRTDAEVDLDCTSVVGRSFVVEPAWIVPGAKRAGAHSR
jgi:quinol monooxygenase YgiN